jgi:hypothetical protein
MRPRVSFHFASATALIFLALALCLGACGTQGKPPPLGKQVRATLTPVSGASAGLTSASVLLTPVDALHVTVYYRGKKLPTVGANTPAQLRKNSCLGALVAPITVASTEGGETPGSAVPSGSPALASFAPSPSGGMDVLVPSSGNLFVVVLNQPGNTTANYLVCGAPLSGQNQYFDLYPPETGSSGIALGTALMTPIIATVLTFSITHGSFTPVGWSIRTGSCTGAIVGSGEFAGGVAKPTGVTYESVGAHAWWITLTESGGSTLCGPAAS